ncbi:MAG: 1-deoxy-D-xylulose-5-phosphate synthase, partial [Clostridiales bacterium]|nr:1-deoxy-D-xylulose-5-phosphate synthase [Clostridiales bacterium]
MSGSCLDRIDSAEDLKKLDVSELPALCRELRDYILAVVSRNGGHLASNLGVVELSVALEYCFDTQKDRLIWDVGHQCYTHKILTGRKDAFRTLRQAGGLSGFPKREESLSDPYDTGHSSTSVAAALGFAKARDLRGEDHHVVAVIGDGALSGGMAFEALNHAGHCASRLIVILNDNEMSISTNVGGLAQHLNALRVRPAYFRTKSEIKNLLSKLPGGGEGIIDFIQRVKVSAKHMVLPGLIFEDLGFTYLGPIDGHSFASLDFILEQAKSIPGPVLVHLLTKKGRGYLPAEEAPERFHGVAPFDVISGMPLSSGARSFTQAFSEVLLELAEQDQRIVAITAAMPEGTGLSALAEKFPERVFDVGIAEEHAVTLAAGMALGGLRPIVAIYSTFLQRAYDQIMNDVALQDLPVIFALD